jgi:RNA polymerase sigma-54 factor
MLKQNLQFKLSQKLSPQQIQLMKLIQLTTMALEQRIKEEMNENPALEGDLESNFDNQDEFAGDDNDDFYGEQSDYDEDNSIEADDINIDEYLSNDETPDYKTQTNNFSEDDDDKEMPYAASVSFHQDLINQLNTFILTDDQRDIAEFLVGSIDEAGYIRRTIPEIVDDMAFTQGIYTDEKTVEEVLYIIHQLEPSGVGARDLQECLVLQLKQKTPTEATSLAIDIIENQFEAFSKKHYDKLLQKYDLSQQTLKKVIAEIEKLNPKPGGAFSGNQKQTEVIIPDFIITIEDDQLVLKLNGRNAPDLIVSKDYKDMLQTYKATEDKSSSQKEAVQFIKQKLDSAKWFIDAIKQRMETLYVTMNAIMHYQEKYFLEGDEVLLKPMILKDIADMVGLDISTISRVANSKYVETPYGIKLLKDFFSESMKNSEGDDVSTIEIKNHLKKMIENEDKRKPLPDDKLADLLKDAGYPIARRTVAKYREQLDFPVARLRKKM